MQEDHLFVHSIKIHLVSSKLEGNKSFFQSFFFLDIIVSEKKVELWNEYFSVIGSFFLKKNKLSRNFYYVIHTSKGSRINI